MIVIPSVDLRGGVCVLPANVGFDEPGSSYHPVSVARAWANSGFQRLNVVDLDADSGVGSNAGLLENIIRDGALDVQASGGVESTDRIQRFADAGATRVVLGARAIEEPRWLSSVAQLFPGLLVVSTDVRARRVVTRGWVRNLPLDIFDVVEDLDGLPLAGLLVSAANGGLQRTNSDLALLEDVAESCEFPVLAVGGVATMADLRALEHRGIAATLLDFSVFSGEIDAHAVAHEFSA